MTYQELCSIESTMGDAVRAARIFASPMQREQMSKGMYLLAEVRNAGRILNDPESSVELREQIKDGLIDAILKG